MRGRTLVESKNTRFRRVYEQAQTLLGTVIEASLKTLEHFGCGRRDEDKFESQLRRTLITLLNCGENEFPLSQLQLDGGVQDKRKTLVKEVIGAFGGDEADTRQITSLVLAADPHIVAVGVFSHQPMIRMDSKWSEINRRLRSMFHEACALHRRLGEMLRDVKRAYCGTPGDAEPGVEQTMALLGKFPDVAEPIYDAAGITGLASYPPVRNEHPLNDAGRAFLSDVEDEIAEERRWGFFKIAGLIVAGIAATVLTAATLGAGAAVLVGVGIGLVHGAVNVASASSNLQHTQDAASIGLASDARVDHALGEVQGAYALLVVDVCTGGLLARFGGSQSISGLMRMTRITTISAGAGGLGMAVNPNTWKSQNAGAIILFGTVMGAAGGAGGHLLGAGAGRLFRPAGTKLQIGVTRAQGVLEKGRTVKVTVNAGDVPVPAKVVAVNKTDATVTLQIDGTNTMIKVGKVAQVSGEIFSKHQQLKGLRPAQKQDISTRATEAYLTRGQIPVEGDVWMMPGNKLMFAPRAGGPAIPVTMAEVSVIEARLAARASGVKLGDFNSLRPHASNFELYKTPGTRGLFTSIDRRNGRLRIIPGASKDHNGAFSGWAYEPLPKFNMRGRGPVPSPNEVAMFMTHGSPWGFGGASTKRAARAMADAIVTANRAAGPKGTQIKFAQLSSCSQGSKRFLVVGKTNAEVFQDQLDRRLLELGINPLGPDRITVLAADKPGLLYGHDSFKAFGKFSKSEFVPAGTQRPNAYPRNTLASAPHTLLDPMTMTSIIIAGGAGAVVIDLALHRDPGEIMAWVTHNSDQVLGYIVEARQPTATTLTLPTLQAPK